jgi:hypothetical protein
MAPSDIKATIVVGQIPGVAVEEQAIDAMSHNSTFAPWSVSIYEFPVK